jgi:hypothetical protein
MVGAHYDDDYTMRPTAGQPWFGSGGTPTGTPDAQRNSGGTGLHAEHHFEYFAPVRAGDVLTAELVPGTQWQKQGRRGGLLSFHDKVVEYRNLRGELVLRSRGVYVRTERRVEEG